MFLDINSTRVETVNMEVVILVISSFVLGVLLAWSYYKNRLMIQELDGSRRERRKKVMDAIEVSFQHEMAELLEKISSRKSNLDFSNFGEYSQHEKDDLQEIHGISSFLEKKLNAVGIYTYEQISKFTPQDVESVTAAIEFFPGRIEKDGWVAQAKRLAKKKVHAVRYS